MRQATRSSIGNDKPYFEYYSSSNRPHERDTDPATSSNGKNGYSHRYDGLPQTLEANQSFSSLSNKSSSRSPSNSAPLSGETLTSQEIKHYKKALKEIYETVKIRAQRLETDSDTCHSEGYNQSDTDQPSSHMTSSSPKIHSVRKRSHLSASKHPRKRRLTEIELQEIYEELRVISQKLKDETRELQAWEQGLREREAMFKDAEDVAVTNQEFVDENLEEELKRRYTILDEEYQDHLNELQQALLEKTKEANRLRDSFNTIRSAHEDLRKQFLDVQDQNKVLESQTLSLQQRLNNLLRKNEHLARQREGTKLVKFDEKLLENVKRNNDDSMKHSTTSKFNVAGTLDVLASLLIWVSDSQLDYTSNKQAEEEEGEERHLSKEHIYGKCVKILPPLADLLSQLPAVNQNVMYPLLKFIYSVILYMDQTPQSIQKPVLTSTLRRIGEDLYKPEVIKQPDSLSLEVKREKRKANIYMRSSDLDERMLSTLIVLKTVSRADYISHSFDVLKSDLREDEGKRLFILHNGVHVVMPFMKQKNKSILGCAVDVILQMSMESGVVTDFLMCCSTGGFFNVCTSLLRERGLEIKILEKLSIVLQRLSKIRSNRRYFEAFQLIPLMQDLLREHDADNAFLSLNLRSILVNLNVAKSV